MADDRRRFSMHKGAAVASDNRVQHTVMLKALDSPTKTSSSNAGLAGLRSLLREPLLHFFVLGALIFAADWAMRPPTKDDNVITVTKALIQSFKDNVGEHGDRSYSDDEIHKMAEAWVASEILYREGKKLGVDIGDRMIRDRIAYKLQVLIFNQVDLPPPTEAELRAWFADNHQRYDEPETVGFYLTQPTDEATARKELADIEAQHESDELRHKTRAILARPVVTLAGSFGEGFSKALLALPTGQWSLIQSKDGWHVVRLDSHRPGKLVPLESVFDDAMRTYRTQKTREQAWEAVKRLKANYTVRYEQ
jgi:PPIC-type PPIASE domain